MTGLDIAPKVFERDSEKAQKEKMENVEFIDYDGITFPFPDRTFSHIVTRYALHHFPDRKKYFAEMNRGLKPGGLLLIFDPTPNENDTERFVDAFMQLKSDEHVKFYTKSELQCLAQRYGFELEHSFFTSITFPSERVDGFQEIKNKYSKLIIDGYDVNIIKDEIYITEQVMNLLFTKTTDGI